MFTITKSEENRIDISMSGKMDSDEMRQALDEIVEKTAGIEHGTLLYDVIDFHIPSLNAIVIEFSRLPSMFGLLGKFDRAAVLTDKSWLKKVSELEGWLIPGIEIKAFDREQREVAMTWLAGDNSAD